MRTVLLALLMCLAAVGCEKSYVSANGTPIPKGLPEQQARFCKLLQDEPIARQRLDEADRQIRLRNPLNPTDIASQENALFSKMFDDLYALVAPSGTFTAWRGKFTVSDTIEEAPRRSFGPQPGKRVFVLSFTPDCFGPDVVDRIGEVFTLATDITPLEDTNVLPDSPLGQSLRQMDLSKPKNTVSGQFLSSPPPPKGGGQWPSGMGDYSHHFYSPAVGRFHENSYHFFVRFTQVSP